MAEYIEREAVVTLLRRCTPTKWQGQLPDGRICHYSDVVDTVRELPAADVAPVMHAKLEKHVRTVFVSVTGWTYDEIRPFCSHCKKEIKSFDAEEYRCCPYCGARLKEDNNGRIH